MSTWTRFLRFNAVSALGIGVQLGILWLLTTAGVDYLAATTLAVAAAVVHNFAWHRQWTWADRDTNIVRAFVAFAAGNGAVSLVTNLVVMTGLVSGAGMAPVLANLVAIGSAGVVNFWIGDRVVFG
ncbi:MAG TPA: GtrA family protein [Vicinamibacterales bacterium]|nr:GtrA family protein [Vicinamibacterales bacterium]